MCVAKQEWGMRCRLYLGSGQWARQNHTSAADSLPPPLLVRLRLGLEPLVVPKPKASYILSSLGGVPA